MIRTSILFILAIFICQFSFFANTKALGRDEVLIAKNLYRMGKIYYKSKQYDDAVKSFKKAYKLSKKSILLYNIALCYEKKGVLKNAILYLKVYKNRFPVEKPKIIAKIKELEHKIRETYVFIQGGIQNSRVIINNVLKGTIPLGQIRVEPNKLQHIVIISEDGHRFEKSVKVHSGTVKTIICIMNEDKKKRVTTKVISPVITNKQPSKVSSDNNSSIPYIFAGIGTASLLSSAVTGTLALMKLSDAKKAGDNNQWDTKNSYEDSARLYGYITDATLALSTVSLVTSLVLYYYYENDTKLKKIRVVPKVDVLESGAVIIGISGRF